MTNAVKIVYNTVMNERESIEQPDDSSNILNNNYRTSRNVRARFELYSFSDTSSDIETLAIESMALSGNETIVDIGTADGNLLHKLRVEHNHKGKLIGVEPNSSQFEASPMHQPIETDIVLQALSKLRQKTNDAMRPELDKELAQTMSTSTSADIKLIEGDANNIPLPDHEADVVMAMFMLYHIPTHKQEGAFEEFKRILKPDGLFVLATSGADNKWVHRVFEERIARILNITAPQPMNAGFTTEKAEVEVARHFAYNRVFKQALPMNINDTFRVECYLNSIRSLIDQFSPVPSSADFEDALAEIVTPVIISSINQTGNFVDHISRSVIFGSNKPLRLKSAFGPLTIS